MAGQFERKLKGSPKDKTQADTAALFKGTISWNVYPKIHKPTRLGLGLTCQGGLFKYGFDFAEIFVSKVKKFWNSGVTDTA